MAKTHGKGAYFALDNSGDVLTDISGDFDTIDYPLEDELADVTAFGDNGHVTISGLQNCQFSISGSFDAAAHFPVLRDAYQAGDKTYQYGPGGNGAGAIRFTAECQLRRLTVGAQVGSRVELSAEFQSQRTVTIDTFS